MFDFRKTQIALLSFLVLAGCVETTSRKEEAPSVIDAVPVLTMPDAPVFKSTPSGSPEELLAAEGKWNLVQEGEVYDPAQAHLAARKKVNPKQMRKRDDLVAHFEPESKSGRDGNFRVLKMQPQGKDWQDDLAAEEGFEVAETSIVKPTQKVVGNEMRDKIRATFVEPIIEQPQSQNTQNIIPIPALKPMREGRIASVPPAQVKPEVLENENTIPQEPDFVLKTPTPKIQKELKPDQPIRTAERPMKNEVGFLGTLRKTFGGIDNNNTKPKVIAQAPQDPVLKNTPKVKYQIISSGASSGKSANLTGFRSALHDGKVRIAMDVSSSVKYKVAIDHIRNVLRVKLENTRWQEPPSGSMRASMLLGTYVTNPQPDGSTILEIRLKKKARIADTVILRPDQTAHHRIVIDLEG